MSVLDIQFQDIDTTRLKYIEKMSDKLSMRCYEKFFLQIRADDIRDLVCFPRMIEMTIVYMMDKFCLCLADYRFSGTKKFSRRLRELKEEYRVAAAYRDLSGFKEEMEKKGVLLMREMIADQDKYRLSYINEIYKQNPDVSRNEADIVARACMISDLCTIGIDWDRRLTMHVYAVGGYWTDWIDIETWKPDVMKCVGDFISFSGIDVMVHGNANIRNATNIFRNAFMRVDFGNIAVGLDVNTKEILLSLK